MVSQLSDVLIQSINKQFVKTDKWNILTLKLKKYQPVFRNMHDLVTRN